MELAVVRLLQRMGNIAPLLRNLLPDFFGCAAHLALYFAQLRLIWP
jgi:hypothetical protein